MSKTGIAARYGWEEFAVIFPNTSIENARNICERIRKIIDEHTFCVNGQKIKVTISVGVADALISPSSSEEYNFVEFANDLLCEAKKLGKNQIKYGVQTICLK